MKLHTSLSRLTKFVSVILAATLLGVLSPLAYAFHGLYTSSLSGVQEVPPNASPGTGTGNLTLTGTAITCSVSVSGLTGAPVAAHIHQGAPGVNGGIIVTLTGGPTVFNCPAGATLTPTQITDLDAGNLYFNVHTGAFPGGEVRGQILHAPVAGPAAPIPTLSQWGILLLSLLIVSAIGWRRVSKN